MKQMIREDVAVSDGAGTGIIVFGSRRGVEVRRAEMSEGREGGEGERKRKHKTFYKYPYKEKP